MIHRVTKEISSSGSFPTLTKTNYYDWAALMRVMLQARGLWIAVALGTTDITEDRMALEVLAKAVPRGDDGDHRQQGDGQARVGLDPSHEHRRRACPQG